MKRFFTSLSFAGLLAAAWVGGRETVSAARAPVSGQGELKFRVLYTANHLPPAAQAVLKSAHGGFAADRRDGKGEIYFALAGAGVVRLSADLQSASLLATAPAVTSTNMHNTKIWYAADGRAFLTFPANDAGKVFTTDLDGRLVHTLDPPEPGADLGHPAATAYFKGRGNFVPTDVEQLDGLLYVATGYSNLDFVLTARILSTAPFRAEWHDLAFGGKGTGPGQFGTGHGITIPPGARRIDVADRPNSEIDHFTRYGHHISTLKMPLGSWPCDIDYLDGYAIVGSLHGPDRRQGAPIYILKDEELVSTIMPRQDLGLENFQHVHNAVLHRHNERFYIIAQAWNPGDFAILEQVVN